MQTVTVRCRAPLGDRAPQVLVEVHVGPGLPGLSLVGLVETAVRESRDRVRAAILNSGFRMPDRRIVVSLAPADLPKAGSRYDLAIAVGILCASGQLPDTRLADCEFSGELALSGELRTVPGLLPVSMSALADGRLAVIPAAGETEGGLLRDTRVLVADSLQAVGSFLNGTNDLKPARPSRLPGAAGNPDLREVCGQLHARRALEIAATGRHHLLLHGPPGTGKSMLASRLPGILPQPDARAELESAAIYSLKGLPQTQWPAPGSPPYRAPHHTASAAALAGGGPLPAPGELSLAHNGVLFLDELPEFRRDVLEVLREPLETGHISIARARRSACFPARIQLVAAMNPCPCGYRGDPTRECRCTPDQVNRYRERVSGPLLDRIDLIVSVPRESSDLFDAAPGEPTVDVRARVSHNRQLAVARSGAPNGSLDAAGLRAFCRPDRAGRSLLAKAANRIGLSRRACDRSLRVARTIADMAGAARIGVPHLAEALGYRDTADNGTPAG